MFAKYHYRNGDCNNDARSDINGRRNTALSTLPQMLIINKNDDEDYNASRCCGSSTLIMVEVLQYSP